jgi:cytochrome P450
VNVPARPPAGRTLQPGSLPTARTGRFDPPPELAWIRAREPLSPLRYPDGHLGWLVTGYHLARTVLSDPRFSADSALKRVPVPRPGADPFMGAPALPGWLVDMDPPAHTRIRRALAGQFTVRRVAALRSGIARIVAEALDAMTAAGPPADLVAEFALPVPSMAICELLGVPYRDRDEFHRHSTTLFALDASAADADAAMATLTGYLRDLVRHKRVRRGPDLLSDVAARDALTDGELAGAGVLLLTAGHETVAGMLGLGTLALLCHPAQREALVRGRVPVDDAVEELLRYLTIFQFGVPRTPVEDVPLAGRVIRAGQSVTVSLPAANRDPDRYPRPDTLALSRVARGHLAFGYGVHQCVGQHLARLELRLAYPALFARLPGLRIAGGPDDVRLSHDMGFYGVHQLPVAW